MIHNWGRQHVLCGIIILGLTIQLISLLLILNTRMVEGSDKDLGTLH